MHDILFALDVHTAGLLDGRLGAVLNKVVVLDHLRADESLLKIGMDHARALGCLAATAIGPGAHLVRPGGEEGLEVQQAVSGLDQPVHTRLLEACLGEEHLPLLVGVQLRDLTLDLSRHDEQLRAFVLDGLAHLLHIGVARCGAGLIHIADVEHGFVGQQEEIASYALLILRIERHRAGVPTLFERLFVACQHAVGQRCLLVATRLCLLLHLGDTALDRLQVTDLQLGVDDLLVAHGVDTAVHVHHVRVVETAQHVQDGVRLADIGQELIPQAFAPAGALHEARDVDNLDRRGHDARGVNQLGQPCEPLVGHGDDAHVGFDGTKRKIRRLRLRVRQAIKQGRLPHVGKPYDSTL